MRRQLLKIICVVAALGFGSIAAAQKPVPIKIGIIQPLSGPVAASGTYILNGARIAVDYINDNGGVLGRPLQLVVEDNQSNPTESANAAEKLIVRDKVSAIIGAWGSTFTLAVLPKMMEYKVPLLVENAGADTITTAGNPYVFRICPTNEMEARSFAHNLATLGVKKADFLVVNNDWGLGTMASMKRIFAEQGIEAGLSLVMDQHAQDISAQLAEVRASGSDTLFVVTAVEQLTLVLKQAEALALDRQLISMGGSSSPDQLIAHAGSAAEGTMHNVMFPPWDLTASSNPELATQFVDEWNKRKLDKAGLTTSFRGFDAVRTLAAAIENAGEAEPSKIQEALWNVELLGLSGQIKFNQAGPEGRASGQSVPNTFLVKVNEGAVNLVSVNQGVLH